MNGRFRYVLDSVMSVAIASALVWAGMQSQRIANLETNIQAINVIAIQSNLATLEAVQVEQTRELDRINQHLESMDSKLERR